MQLGQEERIEFQEFLRDWIDAKWNGEAPEHFKKPLRTSDPDDLGMLIHEWHAYKREKAAREVAVSAATGFVYFVRNGGLYKIGITENLLRRMSQLSPDELLNIVRCTNFQELEQELHKRFKAERLPQTEYFRLSDGQVSDVHRLMIELAAF